MYKLKTPNSQYNGVTEGVPFSKGIGQTDDENIRNILVNDYGYKDVTDHNVLDEATKEIGETTAESAKEMADAQNELSEVADKEATEVEDGIDIEDLTVPQLKEFAKDLNLSNYSKLTRDELIELIEDAQKENA